MAAPSCSTPEVCVAGIVSTSVFWVALTPGDCPVAIRQVTTRNSTRCEDITVTYEDVATGAVLPGAPTGPRVAPPQMVTVCNAGDIGAGAPPPPPPAPVTANGVTCAGAAVTATGLGVVQSVPHPTAVQYTKDCGNAARDALLASILAAVEKPRLDREFVVLCAPTGERVAVQNVTAEDAPIGTAPTYQTWDLAGGTWVGDVTTLADCGGEKIDIANAVWMCAAGVDVSRTDFFTVSPRALVGSLWQNTLGAVIAPPAVVKAGSCATAKLHQNPVHRCVADANGVVACVEAKAWYDEATGALVRLNLLDGTDVTTAWAGAALSEGQCPAKKQVDRLICASMKPVAPATIGEVWELIERTETACSLDTVFYLDPDVSPMTVVPNDNIDFIMNGGACPCCPGTPVTIGGTDLQTSATVAPLGNVFQDGNGVYNLTVNDIITITLDGQNGTVIDGVSQNAPNGLQWNITAPSFLQFQNATITPIGGTSAVGAVVTPTAIKTGAMAVGQSAIVTITYKVLAAPPTPQPYSWTVGTTGLTELSPADNSGSMMLAVL